MRSSLLAITLAVSGCSSTQAAERVPVAPRVSLAKAGDGTCVESGERLVLLVCRRGHDLAWTVTNKTDVTLWAFIAPPSLHSGPRRDNAFMHATGGAVLLRKFQLFANLPEPIFTGAIALVPGASDHGLVPIGARLDPEAQNFYGEPRGQRVTSVTLEVGFAEQRTTDKTHALKEVVIVLNLDSTQQEIVRSPELSWL